MNLDKAKRDLKNYIKEDDIYQSYLKTPDAVETDFDQFCVNHCEAIEVVLKENELIRVQTEYEMNKMWKDKIRAKIEEYEKDKEKFRNYIQIAHKKDEDIRYINDLRFGLNTVIGSIRALQELLEEGE